MCGIAGVLSHRGRLRQRETTAHLSAMIEKIAHRGPDGSGVFVGDLAGLAHRRLAIIDLNERSAQPMRSADGVVSVTFNGEIYNFQILRAELERRGCRFRTESDTEVLIHGWRVWGSDLVLKLRGMFAFALWDEARCELFLARDRFGKKPLFYSNGPERFLFASEIKAILQWPGFPRLPNHEAIHDYLTFHYCIGQKSAFEGVHKLPPAHTLLIKPGASPVLHRYWRMAEVDPARFENVSDDALTAELVERLDDAVRCRLISDVPLGAFLSGGVDSSAVVARMSRMLNEPVKTFSVGFAEDGFDENPFAEAVAEKFETEHRSFRMDHSLVEELPSLVWYYGEPYADSSALVTYALAREIRKHVTVALTGDGGDELFLGYGRYLRFRSLIEDKAAGRSPRLPYETVLPLDSAPRTRDYYARMISSFREEHKLQGYGPALANLLFSSSHDMLGTRLEAATEADALDAVSRVEIETYLPDDLLVKADIATMASGLEGRSPFLDHEFADWALSIPPHRRVFRRNGVLESKALLKKAMEPDLDPAVLYRQKQGFSVPVAHWMQHEIRDYMVDLLTSSRFRERQLINPGFVQFMLDRHFSDYEDHGTRLWSLLCLELWFQTFIDHGRNEPLAVNVSARSRAQLELVS